MRFMYSHFFLFGGYCAFPSLIAWTLKLKVHQKHIELLINPSTISGLLSILVQVIISNKWRICGLHNSGTGLDFVGCPGGDDMN